MRRLFVWGDNEKCQLGMDASKQSEVTRPEKNSVVPAGLPSASQATLAVCGWSHTIAVFIDHSTSEGTDECSDVVFSWGAHEHHQLGRPVTAHEQASSPAPMQFPLGTKLRVGSVACGWKHSLLATETGEVYAWGSGRNGELGLGDAVLTADRPALVDAFRTGANTNVKRVLCGWQHSVFHSSSGEVFTCGNNRHGQLGRATTTASSRNVDGVPRPVKADASGAANLVATQVDVGWHFALCLTAESDGKLVSWGKGSHGQLGLGALASVSVATPVPFTSEAGIREIACGSEHALVVTNDGELFSCGWGEHGNLGLPSRVVAAVIIAGILATGHGDKENRSVLEKVTFFEEKGLDVVSVAAGGAVSIAQTKSR